MSAVAQFASTADYVLDIEERLVEVLDHLVEFHQRLDTLEALAVENAGDPLAILARLDAFENRLARLERHLRRPPPFPITVVENVESQMQYRLNELSGELATEKYQRTGDDRDLRQMHRDAVAAFNQRLDRCADQFCRMRERLTAVEARTASDDKQGAAT
jgi:hypothetical protein